MSDQSPNPENQIQSFDQLGSSGGGWKKPVLIGAVIAVALVILGVLAWIFWPKSVVQTTVAVNNVVPVSNVNNGIKPGAPGGTVTNPVIDIPPYIPPDALKNLQSTKPGQNRPITLDERTEYGLSATDDIWVRTTSPMDGSAPQMSFYNKTVNPSPQPYVNPPEPATKTKK